MQSLKWFLNICQSEKIYAKNVPKRLFLDCKDETLYIQTTYGWRSIQWSALTNNALIPNEHFSNYKFTCKQRQADNWQLLFVFMFIYFLSMLFERLEKSKFQNLMESRLHCFDLSDDDCIFNQRFLSTSHTFQFKFDDEI